MEFLERLERDLLDAADRESLGEWKVAPVAVEQMRKSKRGSAPRWRIVVAAAAAILSLAAAIGFVVQHVSVTGNQEPRISADSRTRRRCERHRLPSVRQPAPESR